MEISQLKYFILTAQLQNMSQASRVLGITQPTLSKSISNLEKELGTELFDRSGKKLILNERGKRFLDGAISSLDELENAASSVKDKSIEKTLRIGLFCISEQFMKCLGEFSSGHPEALFHVYQLHGNPAQIDTNEFDLLIYPRDSLFRKYIGQLAYTETYSLAVHHSNSLAGKKSVSADELIGQKLIFCKYEKKGYDLPYQVYHNTGAVRHGHMYTNSYELQRQMISAGCGIGFVPSGCRSIYEADDSIVLIPITGEGFSQDIHIGFKREKHLSEGGREFTAFVTNYFGLEKGAAD